MCIYKSVEIRTKYRQLFFKVFKKCLNLISVEVIMLAVYRKTEPYKTQAFRSLTWNNSHINLRIVWREADHSPPSSAEVKEWV
jgi:hypothetical protein